jgi:hypothetical protein
MKKRIIIFLLLVSVVLGCMPIKQSKVPTETNFKSKNANGLVIGTVTFVHPKKKSPFDKYRFHLSYESDNVEEKKNNSTFFTVNVNQFNGRFNGELNENKTFPFVLEQKPGKYNFDGFSFFWNGGFVTNEIHNVVKFSLPFNVEESKITYIGNIIVNVKSKVKPYIEITDQLDENINYFKEKYPNIDWSLVNNKTIKEGEVGDGFIKLN